MSLQENIDHQQSEVESLQELVKSLQKENKELHDAVTMYRERERLIVGYPDLNQDNIKSPMIQGTVTHSKSYSDLSHVCLFNFYRIGGCVLRHE